MSVSEDRKYTKAEVYSLLERVKGKTLGEVDNSCQFTRTQKNEKITGIAGDVIEQSVFGYARDSRQECDIEIDGLLTELKTTGVRVPKSDLKNVEGKCGDEYNMYLGAKEGISITGVTFEPEVQTNFLTSHFWEKAERLLIVFYEYNSYEVVPASRYAKFPIVDYCYNTFSENERKQLQRDWEIVRDYLLKIYSKYMNPVERNEQLEGFTHKLRPNLLLIELVPGFKKRASGSYQKPRYRLKQTFVDYIVRGHFNKKRKDMEVQLKETFSSYDELDRHCHELTKKYKGMTFPELKKELEINADITQKNFGALCVIQMFDVSCNRLNEISDFTKAGIIAKTITVTPSWHRTEDMKLQRIDFEELADRDLDFEESEMYSYFCEHSFLCPIFFERGNKICETTFEGFKRFAFDEEFIEGHVRKTWNDTRALIHQNRLEWVYVLDNKGNKQRNRSGSYKGAPNFPKSSEYEVFLRGGAGNSSDEAKTESVNGIKMLPQFFWLKGSYIVKKLQTISFL